MALGKNPVKCNCNYVNVPAWNNPVTYTWTTTTNSNPNTITYVHIKNKNEAYICEPLSNGTWIINKGSNDGVEVDDLYSIPDGEPDKILDPKTVIVLGYAKFEYGVSEVFDNYSYCFVREDMLSYTRSRKPFRFSGNCLEQQTNDGEFKFVGTKVTLVEKTGEK